jgi:hypothetical protein
MRRAGRWLSCVVIAALCVGTARADVGDLGYWLTLYFGRVNDPASTTELIAMIAGIMLVNYVCNFLVIGLPASRLGSAGIRLIAIGLVWFTLLGQVADRLGAVVAFWSDNLIFNPGLASAGRLLALNFLFSGIAIGLLAVYFLRRRWDVAKGATWWITAAAVVFTNPAWALAYAWWAH